LCVPFLEPGGRLRREDFLAVMGLGVVGVTLTQTVFTIGVSLSTAANTALVYSTVPVWGMLLGFILGLERPRLAGIFGIGLSLVTVGEGFYPVSLSCPPLAVTRAPSSY
jgi:drug/metabolite transporter (DMT)-like permease